MWFYHVERDSKPPWFYLPMHPAARLTESEKQMLIDGAEKSFGPQAAPEKR
jgi:Haem-binding domain